jgi:hypothetical protein
MDQPYRSYALDLLSAQKYPADEAPYEAYDDVTYALPFFYGVAVTSILDPAVRDLELDPVVDEVTYSSAAPAPGAFYLLADTGQEALLAARVALADFEVEAAEAAFRVEQRDYPAGSWIVPDQPGLGDALAKTASAFDLRFDAVGRRPDVRRHRLEWPRLAVLQSWDDTESAGWVRMVFDDRRIPYTLLMDDEIRRGTDLGRFDVILYPHTYQSLKDIIQGIDPAFGPLAYTFTPEFPSHGTPTSSPDISGGLSWSGVQRLQDFVTGGGLLITLGGASTIPLDGGLARDLRRARTKSSVYCPGSELRARFVRPDHPLAFGYREVDSFFRDDLPLYAVRHADRGRVVLQWGAAPAADEDAEPPAAPEPPKTEPLVVSGGVKGAAEIEGKPAILDVELGRGRIVAFNFDPIHRYLALSDFRLVWNALLNWNDLPATEAGMAQHRAGR